MLIVSIIAFILGLVITICGVIFTHMFKGETDHPRKSIFNSFSKICALIAAICFASAVLLPIGVPQYKVWQQSKEGEAELAKAEQNRQIAIQEARAKEESAVSLANAEVIRAEGVAKANKIIGDSLQNNDAYIHYLWIEALRESDSDVIYIPTEAGIPITESARFVKNAE